MVSQIHGPSVGTPNEIITKLELQIEALSVSDTEKADKLELEIVKLLRQENLDKNLRRRLVQAKFKIRKIVPKVKFPVNNSIEHRINPALYDESHIPTKERNEFLRCLQLVPNEHKNRFIMRLNSALGFRHSAQRVSHLRGILFEMSRIIRLLEQGLEQLESNLEEPIKVTFFGYDKDQTNFSDGDGFLYPTYVFLNSTIESDIPIIRDGKLFVYEVKSYPFMVYGDDAVERNQLLKYQNAIEQGLVAGVTVEVQGRIDLDFLRWAIGEKIGYRAIIPDVEIVYTFPLPSGNDYRFILKRVKNGGLKFVNTDKYSEEDLKIIRGIHIALADKSILDIISETMINPDDASEQLRPLLKNPEKIFQLEDFEEYERLRNKKISELLANKNISINTENINSSYSENATKEFVLQLIVGYQDYLRKNPKIAEEKNHYVISDDQIPLALELTLENIQMIRDFELKRKVLPEESQRQKYRTELGWAGKPEGVALDMEHIMLDTIYSINKNGFERANVERSLGKDLVPYFFTQDPKSGKLIIKFKSEADLQQIINQINNPYISIYEKHISALRRYLKESEYTRSYNWTERFNKVEDISDLLKGQDRRYMEIQTFDPTTGSTTRQRDTNETEIERTKHVILLENIKRARQFINNKQGVPRAFKKRISEIEISISELDQKKDTVIEECRSRIMQSVQNLSRQIKDLEKQRNALQIQRRDLDEINNQINILVQQRSDLYFELKSLSNEYQSLISAKYKELEELYTRYLREDEWRSFAQRIVKTIDHNIVKFIYIVTAEGEVIVQEEKIREVVSGRAAHSELAQGRNVYGAGELAFTKVNDQWVLTEINNGSGHYRPESHSTLHYVKNLLNSKGIDVRDVDLIDSILRGVAMRDFTAY